MCNMSKNNILHIMINAFFSMTHVISFTLLVECFSICDFIFSIIINIYFFVTITYLSIYLSIDRSIHISIDSSIHISNALIIG